VSVDVPAAAIGTAQGRLSVQSWKGTSAADGLKTTYTATSVLSIERGYGSMLAVTTYFGQPNLDTLFRDVLITNHVTRILCTTAVCRDRQEWLAELRQVSGIMSWCSGQLRIGSDVHVVRYIKSGAATWLGVMRLDSAVASVDAWNRCPIRDWQFRRLNARSLSVPTV
jgi:hypothetical protein